MHVTTPSAFASTQLARPDNRSGRRRQSGGRQRAQATGSAHSMIEPAAELWLIGFYGPCFTDLIDFGRPTALHGGPRQHTRQGSQQAGSAVNADRGKEVPNSTMLSLPARRKSMISFMPSGRSPKAPEPTAAAPRRRSCGRVPGRRASAPCSGSRTSGHDRPPPRSILATWLTVALIGWP